MSLESQLIAEMRSRQYRRDVSPWHKAIEMMELRDFLRFRQRPHSTRQLAALMGVARQVIAEQRRIASRLSRDVLKRAGVFEDQMARLPTETLLQLTALGPTERDGALSEAVAASRRRPPVSTEERRSPGAVPQTGASHSPPPDRDEPLTPEQASRQLLRLAPSLAAIAQRALGAGRSHLLAETPDGGYLIYLSPL